MVKDKYYGKRLCLDNIEDYMITMGYISDDYKEFTSKLPIVGILQRDFEDKNDCTISSITSYVKYFTKDAESTIDVYNYVREISKKYFYNGDTYGFVIVFIKNVLDKVLSHFHESRKTKCLYVKGLGFNLDTMIRILDWGIPIILSVTSDGRGYYSRHTVTVYGYHKFISSGGTKVMLMVYDNWNSTRSYIDYSKMSALCSICY